MTAATAREGGFDPEQRAAFRELLQIFALHVEKHIANRVSRNVLDVYLGSVAGKKVLSGAIDRGAGEAIHAVIWVSDMRGFTKFSDNLPAPAVLALLNAYFERVAGAVLDHGGEVLKFIGDGLLAVFPFKGDESPSTVVERGLSAAMQALSAVEGLNADPPPELMDALAIGPIRSGIALHGGDVFFGNMGTSDRFDFTVIGRAVNEASRVEALTKTLGRAIVLTSAVAKHVSRPLDDLGAHALRGLAEPMRLFSPSEADDP
ncbi:MAG: adenylate/guanylate cyclase domain-containing protein [Alphaproteobacteria bacterium]|jgi:adenylate cyclase|nr:adenylate/guanylate cyclase domain-containing protein [Rhodospirillaceae bacterium]MBT6511365.1 adenylate/guanylate cyclase domain-containing protein [Rhodospirillaceae bacterium]MBT7615592.1 adenylate/guanylate cyclase domain-containing protein [Rhodospirillaceae bacterium]MBT7648327.1 adenylate/guanylate cyclase domain-containing protein [Rhodospirillaceae bacterium]MDG2480438.1 adenylate/guanylate cyclase domain-containing protein [Alphaproteobacteria bacterium]